MSDVPRFWYGPTGTLLCDRAIPEITHALHGDLARIYAAPFYVAEGCTRAACEKIAAAGRDICRRVQEAGAGL